MYYSPLHVSQEALTHIINYIGAIPHRGGYYREGTGPIFLHDVECTGGNDLLNCSYTSAKGCLHIDDIGVDCSKPLNLNYTIFMSLKFILYNNVLYIISNIQHSCS